ncbi:hypothetical protein ABZP36_014637 [Zizania latifolia]
MAAEGSALGSPAAAAPPPPPKRRKIEPSRRCQLYLDLRSREPFAYVWPDCSMPGAVQFGDVTYAWVLAIELRHPPSSGQIARGDVGLIYSGLVLLGHQPQLSGGSGNKPSQVVLDKDKVAPPSSSSVSGTPPARVDLDKVREAKRFAVFQAQHEGCLGSYKSFDSLFGNYLVPVIPSNDFFVQIAKK